MTTMLMPQKQYERPAPERPAPRIPDSAWQAIASRDASRDGQFVYGVRTTHIYCRPSCPSRQPRLHMRTRQPPFGHAAVGRKSGMQRA